MQLPPEFFSTTLSSTEFRILVSMYHMADRNGAVDASMEELGILSGYGREAIRRTVRHLEEEGILATTRTKRNFGKLFRNRYQFLVASPMSAPVDPLRRDAGWTVPVESAPARGIDESFLCLPLEASDAHEDNLQPEASTGGLPVDKSTELPGLESYIANKQESFALGTSFLKGHADGAPKIETEESDMNRWNADDDFVGGVGMFDDEVAPSGKPKPKADRRKASTRGQRPESEWTANDVAAEFAYQFGRRFPYTPGLVNVAAVRGALLRYRGQFGTTPEVEMEIMRMYFEDEYNLKLAQEKPTQAHGKYLAMFKTAIPKAHERLGLDYFESRVVIDQEDAVEYLYSTDGREFENNMSGRAALASYERRLAERLQNANS